MKYATVRKDTSGYWEAVDRKTGERIEGLCGSELEAYRRANRNGYLVL